MSWLMRDSVVMTRYADLSNEAKLQAWLDYTPNNDDMAHTKRVAVRKFRKAIREEQA